MSRAEHIYLIADFGTGKILHAFTVKYECAYRVSQLNPHEITVCRIRDGHHHPDAKPVLLNSVTLEPWVDPEDES